MTKDVDNNSYINLLQELKTHINTSRIKAHLAVNKEMIHFYTSIEVSGLQLMMYKFLMVIFNFLDPNNNQEILRENPFKDFCWVNIKIVG